MKEGKKCSNCGAPITTEICPYCHNATGLDTATANMEYPVIECKEANIHFWNTAFPMIFAVSFGFFGFIIPIVALLEKEENILPIFLFCSIFGIIGLVAFIISFRSVIRYLKVKTNGNRGRERIRKKMHLQAKVHLFYERISIVPNTYPRVRIVWFLFVIENILFRQLIIVTAAVMDEIIVHDFLRIES